MENEIFDLDAFRALPLPTEEEVMANWQGDINKPVVSILCHMFNQEMYIEDAFRGFLMQKTDFVFEVIAHDDASTDSTSDIIKEYANRYPKIFKPVIQTENQYSKGAKPCLLSSPHAKGEYFALCEGDDFWIDENKLANQYKLALEHKAGLVFSSCFKLFNNDILSVAYLKDKLVYSGRDAIKKIPKLGPTASYFFPKAVIEILPTWFEQEATVGDIFIELYSNKLGPSIYYDQPSVIYRVESIGSWTADSQWDIKGENAIRHNTSVIKCLKYMKEDCFFNDLDFSVKLQNLYLGLSLGYLKNKQYISFVANIEMARKLGKLSSKLFQLLYSLRKLPKICRGTYFLILKLKQR